MSSAQAEGGPPGHSACGETSGATFVSVLRAGEVQGLFIRGMGLGHSSDLRNPEALEPDCSIPAAWLWTSHFPLRVSVFSSVKGDQKLLFSHGIVGG